MRVNCHQKITNDVMKVVNHNFPRDFLQGIYRGIIAADAHRNKYIHYHARHGIDTIHFHRYVRRYIDEAAKLFCEGKHREAGYFLGIAMHIAQDLAMLRGSSGWHYVMEKDIEKTLSNLDQAFIRKCIESNNTRLYTISTENIICIAYTLTAKTFELFLDKVRKFKVESRRMERTNRKRIEASMHGKKLDTTFLFFALSVIVFILILLFLLTIR